MQSIFPLIIESDGQEKTFNSKEDLDLWVEQVTAAYQWLPDNDPGSKFKRPLDNNLKHIKSQSEEAIRLQDSGDPALTQINDIRKRLRNILFGREKYFMPDSPRLRFVQKIAEKDPDLAAAGLSVMMRPSDTIADQALFVRGTTLATAYELGLIDITPEFQNGIDALIDQAENRLRAIETVQASVRVDQEKIRERNTKRRLFQRRDFGEFLNATRQEWAALQLTYDKDLALQKSVSYWGRKVVEYRKATNWSWAALILAIVGAGSLIAWGSLELIERTKDQGDQVFWFRLSIVTVYATIIIMMLRMLMKPVMVNQHLRVDAEHRVTMITTYLALLREGNALEGSDRKLIIEALFRPAHSGLVSNDASGPSIVEQLATIMTRRPSG